MHPSRTRGHGNNYGGSCRDPSAEVKTPQATLWGEDTHTILSHWHDTLWPLLFRILLAEA